ncbi:hypothetical protein ACQKN7_09640 [Bacillus cereus]|uniref:hypothetical protein n=1 Tax=Bacillus cereus TaxID=1396 RepID=UPI003D049139
MLLEDDSCNFVEDLPEEAMYTGFTIGEMRFILFFDPDAKPEFSNAFSENFINKQVCIISNDVVILYTPYTLLNSSTLAYSCNSNLEVIKESFSQIDPFANDEVAYISNDFCLTCIHAYDLSKNEDFLDLAEYIYSKYQGDTLTPEILYINQTQIKKRREGELSETDIHRLFSIKQERYKLFPIFKLSIDMNETIPV